MTVHLPTSPFAFLSVINECLSRVDVQMDNYIRLSAGVTLESFYCVCTMKSIAYPLKLCTNIDLLQVHILAR